MAVLDSSGLYNKTPLHITECRALCERAVSLPLTCTWQCALGAVPTGQEGPKTKEPSKYIRYIYNRIILENATVRAAAVSALANFGAACEALRPRIIVLLRRALSDNDDEVRQSGAGPGKGAGTSVGTSSHWLNPGYGER